MSKYRTIYGGPEYLIHLKISECINKVFVAMMYGLTIPLLFPVAAFNLAFTCFCEKVLIAWQHRQPPLMGDELTNYALSLLRYAPLIMCCNGWWMLDNK